MPRQVLGVVVVTTCSTCGGESCADCKGTGREERSISLEEFAKLFTYGQTYNERAMQGLEAPDNTIRARQQSSADPKESP
jgi:hypothetical protein